jgi:glycosyltransferase involved in cell wall biosynthesis
MAAMVTLRPRLDKARAAGDLPAVPRVSVLLPAFDAERTLPAALASVARQSLCDFECIVVDDGSRDGTSALARAFAARDPRFAVLSVPHAGLVAALNAGLERCRGDVVARMDADDLMHRDRLAAQLARLDAAPDLAAVGSRVRLFPRAGLSDGLRDYGRWLNGIDSPARVRADAFVECPIAHPTLAIRREILRDFGYRDRGWPEDYDLVLRLLERGQALDVVPRRLLSWRDHPQRLTRVAPACRPEQFPRLKAEFLARGLLAGHEEYVLWGYGHTGRALRRALLAHDKRPSHVVELHPGRLGNSIHGAPVVPPQALADLPRRPVVASVAGAEPRRLIRAALDAIGRRELFDYVCAA